jgi:hypothetical protein
MTEADFTGLVADFFGDIENLQAAAHELRAEGGDVKGAFLAAFPEEVRPMMESQYGLIAMLFGM